MRATMHFVVLAAALPLCLGDSPASRAAAEPPPGALVVAQTSVPEERKEAFLVQTRNEVLALRNQVQQFRRQLGEGSKPEFVAAERDFEAKATVLFQKLDEIGALPPQQARARKFEIDSAYQAVQSAYDRVVQVTD